MAQVNPELEVVTADNGRVALEKLQNAAQQGPEQLPALVLVDLNMPGMNGRELIKEIKANPILQQIPVVVLTTSLCEGDIKECYKLGANEFVTKPNDLEGFINVMREIYRNWCTMQNQGLNTSQQL